MRGLDHTISQLFLQSSENQLKDFPGISIFDQPFFGVADGDDPLFKEFQKTVSSQHLIPREILKSYAKKNTDLSCIRVISWVLPYTEDIRDSNRNSNWPSKLYSLARNNGGALNHRASLRLTEMLKGQGFAAISPMHTREYDAFRSQEHTFSSTWSERHVAFAAGLGRFGLNGSLITARGSNVRFGSLITNIDLEPNISDGRDYRAACLKSSGKDCTACIKRCPVGAITESGMEKSKCYAMRQAVRKRYLDSYSQELHMLPAPVVKNGKREEGYSLGCALCQCGVPCEGQDPYHAGY